MKKGATYRLLGGSPIPELISEPVEFETDDTIQRMELNLSSFLRQELCNPNKFEECQFQSKVVLSNSKTCIGIECEVENIRVVQIGTIFYEYVRTPCVNQAFYNDAKKISPYSRSHSVMCGNPALDEASEACCSFASTTATRNAKYDGERMRFSTATERCKEVSKNICDFSSVGGDRHKISNYFWTSDDCQLRLKIRSDGMIAIIHQPFDSSNRVQHLEDNNENWFRVYWKGDKYPNALNDCDGVCEVVNGNSCLCGSSPVSKSIGFSSTPATVKELLGKLHIGFPDPSIFDSNYTSSFYPDSGITVHLKNDLFDSTTAFEFLDKKGRRFFMKNSIETVRVHGVTSGYTGYSFRNAPHFMSFVPSGKR